MKIRGVFSMSIINRLKSLFKEEKDFEEKDVQEEISKDVNSESSDFDDTVVSGTKTSVPISDVLKKEKSSTATIELKFKKEVRSIEEESVEETLPIIEEDEPSNNEEIPKEAEEDLAEESLDVEENTSSDEEDVNTDDEVESTEKVDEDKKEKENKERDNMTLLTDIDAGIETVKHCFQCGTCGGGCPSGRRTPYKVRQIVRKCLLGLKEDVITDDALWMCTTCYTCQERCPRSVKIVEIIKKARNVAAHAGYMAKPHKMTGVFVINTGHGVPINDAAKALRTKIGLSEVPATTHADAGALEEVQKLCKLTAFDELIGYDEATGGLKE